ncbi:MarR family winged helix-turn-helix transcriptional regulator [Streptomyces sp. NPDC002143]
MSNNIMRPPALLALPSYLAGNVARIGQDLLLQELEQHGLRLTHFAVMTAVNDFGAMAQIELSSRLDVDPSHIVTYVDHLEAMGLVARERDPADRRRTLVSPTPRCRQLQRTLNVAAQRSQSELLNALSPAEQRTLVDLLSRVVSFHDAARRDTTSRMSGEPSLK